MPCWKQSVFECTDGNTPWLGNQWNHQNVFLHAVHHDVADVRDPNLIHEPLHHTEYRASWETLTLTATYSLAHTSEDTCAALSKQSTNKIKSGCHFSTSKSAFIASRPMTASSFGPVQASRNCHQDIQFNHPNYIRMPLRRRCAFVAMS